MALSIGTVVGPNNKRGMNQCEKERKTNFKCQQEMMMRAAGCLMCGKSLSPPLNINKQPAAVTNTDKREINCGDRDAYREREEEEK